MRKKLTIHSCQHLDKTGDNEKLLLKISIDDDIDIVEKGKHNTKKQVIIVNASRSVIREWEIKNPQYKDFVNVANGMLHYALEKIRERVKQGQIFNDGEEVFLDSYVEYTPPDPDVYRITIPYTEIIEYKGKLGFL